MLKIGLGQDIHRLEAGGPLVLGGVSIPCDLQAIAHSDGDALIHAVIDALVTPVTGENIGTLFPDHDPAYQGADSMRLLGEVQQKYLRDIKIHHLDCVITLDRPKLASYIPEMCAKIAHTLRVEPAQISIKAKTSEKTAPDMVQAAVVCLFDMQ